MTLSDARKRQEEHSRQEEIMYRPPGWTNPYLQQDEKGNRVSSKAYEAGVDAMLKGLIAKPSSRRVESYCEYYGQEPVNGTWVFIPEG